jgi:NitT/TauT family transport system substrate-binding protein
MSRSDRLLFPVTSALAVALSVACGIADAAAQTAQKVSMRLDWVISGYHAPYFVGIKNGYYKDEGLDVTTGPPTWRRRSATATAISPPSTAAR